MLAIRSVGNSGGRLFFQLRKRVFATPTVIKTSSIFLARFQRAANHHVCHKNMGGRVGFSFRKIETPLEL
jgi:hypothetical protein